MVPQLDTVHVAGAAHNIRREQFARYVEVVHGSVPKVAATV